MSSFHTWSLFYLPSDTCWIVSVPSPNVALLLIYLTIGYFLLVHEAPRALVAKTKRNQSQEREASLLEVLHSHLMSRYRLEGWCLRLRSNPHGRQLA